MDAGFSNMFYVVFLRSTVEPRFADFRKKFIDLSIICDGGKRSCEAHRIIMAEASPICAANLLLSGGEICGKLLGLVPSIGLGSNSQIETKTLTGIFQLRPSYLLFHCYQALSGVAVPK